MYDVIVIGAGVTGSAVARELSRFNAKICVLERAEDVCSGTTKANSGIVHAGFDAEPGTLKAKMNIRGNQMMEQLSEDLDFPFEKNGSLVLCMNEEEEKIIHELYDRGQANGVKDLQILSGKEVLEMEPNVTDQVHAALYAPTGGIVCPFGLNIALAENAAVNGAEFHFETKVESIRKDADKYIVETSAGTFEAKAVVNAAGVYADEFHNMVSEKKITIVPRKGEYCLLDKSAGKHVRRTIFSVPGKYGKGVLVTPTAHGNLMIGPTSIDIENKEGTNTTAEGLSEAMEKAGKNVRNLPLRDVITSFAGLRAHEVSGDFIIGEAEDAPGFFDCAGIESPGLTSAPAIGEYVAAMISEKLGLEKKDNFIATRKGIVRTAELDIEERNKLIRENPAYGTVICRCEKITEGEIVDAIRRPLGARSVDGIKRRTRAGMGRCQAGFCLPRTLEILSRELGIPQEELTKCGGNSRYITADVVKEAEE